MLNDWILYTTTTKQKNKKQKTNNMELLDKLGDTLLRQ
jgi:hypothetical protein